MEKIYDSKRILEIDLFKGISIILMVISNFVTDLNYFLGYSENLGFWNAFAIFVAILFVFISGVSFNISYSKKLFNHAMTYEGYVERSIKLFLAGILITTVTDVFLTHGTIYFGILSFLALSGILGIFFYKFKRLNLVFAIFFIFFGFILANYHVNTIFLLPFGITPYDFYMLDFFPVFPWFGVYLIGMFFSNIFYKNGFSKFSFERLTNKITNELSILGRNTLKIYLIHQPILVGILILKYGVLTNLKI